MPLTTIKYPLLLTVLLSLASFSISACEKNSKTARCQEKAYSKERYSASRNLIRHSVKLRTLIQSDCREKVRLFDHVASDLTTVRKNLSKDGKFRLSKELPILKRYSVREINQKIRESKRITGNIDKICRSLKSEYNGRYKKAKRDFFKSMGIKTQY